MSGETVVDLLPRGRAFMNPYTGGDDGLVNHTAVRAGQTGYAWITGRVFTWDPVTMTDNEQTGSGYVISGRSRFGYEFLISSHRTRPMEVIVLSHCRTVQLAVEEFARQNGGVYPSNVGVDATWYGDTVCDFLPGGVLLENPYHGCATEPVDCAAATGGQIGYIPVSRYGINVGYTITGTAEVCGTTANIIWVAPSTDRSIER
jgi:hypothetical protein